MNILLIVPEFPPNHIGWWGIVFENLAKTYQNLWRKVLVFTGDHTKKNIFSPINIENIDWIDIVKIPELYTPLSMLDSVMPIPIWYSRSIKKIIRNFNPDFTHIHWYWLFMPAQLGKICRQISLDYTFTIHWAPVSPDKMNNALISNAYKFYHKFYGFPLLNWAKSITAVSQYAKEFDIFHDYRDKIIVVWNWINPSEYTKVGTNVFTEKWIQTNNNTIIILSLWRIEWIKGFDKIIRLIPQMINSWYDVKYVIAWRDNWAKNSLQQLAKELEVEKNIHYLGFIENDEKMSALTHCNVVAIPSETESYWLVALEARLFLKPVITTFAGWLKDALDWYNWAYKLDDYEKSFNWDIKNNKNISDFYWQEIANKYILTK